jgi:CheY-like chemotaxis protein
VREQPSRLSRVPRASLVALPLPLLADTDEASSAAPAGGLHILVVEDHEDSREMMRHFLESAGHRVSEAADGATGVVEALRLRPDVAVIDVGLPGLDGYEVAKRIRDAQLASIRLIALSGHGLPQDRSRASEAGFDEHLVKPVTPQELADVLARNTGAPQSRR